MAWKKRSFNGVPFYEDTETGKAVRVQKLNRGGYETVVFDKSGRAIDVKSFRSKTGADAYSRQVRQSGRSSKSKDNSFQDLFGDIRL